MRVYVCVCVCVFYAPTVAATGNTIQELRDNMSHEEFDKMSDGVNCRLCYKKGWPESYI